MGEIVVRSKPARTARHSVGALKVMVVLCSGALGACSGSASSQFELMASEEKSTASGLASTPTMNTDGKSVRLPRGADALTYGATPGNKAYKIGPQDVLDVSVYKVPDLTRSAPVDADGTINLPLLGDVVAVGKTTRELERELASKLGGKYLQSPQVTVTVKEYNSQRVTIEGAVKSPGVHPLRGKTSLMQIVAMSGGLDAAASDSTVVVFRHNDGKRYAARFDFDEIRKGKAADPDILPGDVIVANSSALKSAWGDFLKALPIASFAMVLL